MSDFGSLVLVLYNFEKNQLFKDYAGIGLSSVLHLRAKLYNYYVRVQFCL